MNFKHEAQTRNAAPAPSKEFIRRTIRSYQEILDDFFLKHEFHRIFDESSPLQRRNLCGDDVVK